MRARSASLTVIAAVAWSARAEAVSWPDADTKTLPCRPTIACTADLAPTGALEIEAGHITRELGGTRQISVPVLAKLTVAPWVQLQLGTNGYTAARGATRARYLDDIVPGVKFHLVDQEGARPSLSISGALSVPTFDGQTGYARTYDALFTGYVTKDFGPLHADLNVGFDVWRLDAAPALPQAWTALALSAPLPEPFGVMLEAYYFSDAAPVAPRDGGILFALTMSPAPWLIFDVGGDAGWFPATRAYSAFFGMTIIPVRLWTP